MMKTVSGRRASQKFFELYGLIKSLQEKECVSYLEIGARHGDTFYEVVKALPKGGKYLAVDLPGGAWGVSSSKKHLQNVIRLLKKEGWKNVDCIFGNSQDAKTIARIAREAPFDACLIDGDHRYEGVKADWENYRSMARKIVAFHDIDGEGVRKDGMEVQVPRLWREIRSSGEFETKDFISDEEPDRPMGIGVVFI